MRSRQSLLSKGRDLLLAVAILALLALVVDRYQTQETRSLHGVARIADGDSLSLGAVRVRLEGIDAPEFDQTCVRVVSEYPCGRLAREALSQLVGGGRVSCEGHGEDRYGRLLARCTAGGVDINEAMVEQGWAVSYGDYRSAEQAARQAGRGLWAGTFDRPQEWRRVHGGLVESRHDGLGRLFEWLSGIFSLWQIDDDRKSEQGARNETLRWRAGAQSAPGAHIPG